MKQADIQNRGRYVAKIDGVKTIVTAYLTPSGFRFRNERTSFFCSCSARKCWRPAAIWEQWDSRTVQEPPYKEHCWAWFEGKLWMPIVDVEDSNDDIGEWMLNTAIMAGKEKIIDMVS